MRQGGWFKDAHREIMERFDALEKRLDYMDEKLRHIRSSLEWLTEKTGLTTMLGGPEHHAIVERITTVSGRHWYLARCLSCEWRALDRRLTFDIAGEDLTHHIRDGN